MTLYKPKVALGYAFSGKNIGGVRKYMENIEKLSFCHVSIFPSYEIDQVWKNSNYDTMHMREMKKYIEDNQQEIIDNHDIFHSNVEPTFIKLCEEAQRQGKFWIHTYHSIYTEEAYGKLLPWMVEINDFMFNVACKADICLCVAEWLIDTLKNVECKFVPNFIDINNLDNISQNVFKEKNDLNDYLLFVGNISHNKNCQEFIKTAALLPEYQFVLIGTGLTESEIESTQNIKLTKNVHALGPLSHIECLEAMKDCNILIINSFIEGLPTVLIEALYFSIPCIIPDGPNWSKYLLKDKELGFKYPFGDTLKLSDIIQSIMSDYSEMVFTKQYVRQTYSSEVIINKLDLIYKNE
tara:strand:- start:148 stop:1203 length:1056 start_codon:yes stop_codon:yes gene_type:complete